MPSFDIVSQVNSMEIENAVNQANKELANRFDFKGTNAEIVLERNEIKLSAADQFKINALTEIVMGRLANATSASRAWKRPNQMSPRWSRAAVIKIKQGIETTVAKQITGFIRDGKFKVTTQIPRRRHRVTGKSRDELQTVIGASARRNFPCPSVVNFRISLNLHSLLIIPARSDLRLCLVQWTFRNSPAFNAGEIWDCISPVGRLNGFHVYSVLISLCFSTKERRRLITPALRDRLWPFSVVSPGRTK